MINSSCELITTMQSSERAQLAFSVKHMFSAALMAISAILLVGCIDTSPSDIPVVPSQSVSEVPLKQTEAAHQQVVISSKKVVTAKNNSNEMFSAAKGGQKFVCDDGSFFRISFKGANKADLWLNGNKRASHLINEQIGSGIEFGNDYYTVHDKDGHIVFIYQKNGRDITTRCQKTKP